MGVQNPDALSTLAMVVRDRRSTFTLSKESKITNQVLAREPWRLPPLGLPRQNFTQFPIKVAHVDRLACGALGRGTFQQDLCQGIGEYTPLPAAPLKAQFTAL